MIRFGQYARNVGMLIGQSLVQRVLGMVTTVLLARLLGPAGFGAYSVVMATSNSAYGLVRLGVDGAIHVHTAEGFVDEAGRRRMEELLAAGCLLLLAAGGIGALACFLFAEPLASAIYGKPELAAWIRVAGVAVFLQSVSQFFYTSLVGLHRFYEYTRIMLGGAIVNVLAITLGAEVAGLVGAVTGLIGAQAIITTWLGLEARNALRRQKLRLSLRNSLSRARSLLTFGFPSYLAAVLAIPVIYYVQGLIVQNHGIEALGQLRIVTAIAVIVSFAPTSAAAAMVSMFAQTQAQDSKEFSRRVFQNIRYGFLFATGTSFLIICSVPALIQFLFGVEYLPAISAAQIALVSAVLTAVTGVISNALYSGRKVIPMAACLALQSLLFLAASSFLVPMLGLEGYVISEFIGHIVYFVCGIGLLWKYWEVDIGDFARVLSLPLPFFLLMGAYQAFNLSTSADVMVQVLVGAGGFLFLIIWGCLIAFNRGERDALLARMSTFGRMWKGRWF